MTATWSSGETRPAALERSAAILGSRGRPLLIDGLAYGAFPGALARRVGPRSVVLLHHPLDRECDVPREIAEARYKVEKAALAFARGVIATSEATARDLVERFDLPPERCAIAEPGVEPAPRSPASGQPPTLLSVGAVIPRKGHDLLVEALGGLPESLTYRLEIAGPMGRAAAHEAALRRRIDALGLSERIAFLGAISDAELERAYRRADIVVSPSRYEGYGIAATEAIARGLPLIAGSGGALAETAAAGVVVDVEDRKAFAEVLACMIGSPQVRAEAAEASWTAAQRLPRWERTAERVVEALRRFFHDGDGG